MTASEIASAPVITDAKMTSMFTKCMQNMQSWGIKLPRNIVWNEGLIRDMAETVWLEDTLTRNTTIHIILNAGLKTQADSIIEDTIYHELAHASTGEGHTAKWYEVVGVIRKHTGLRIEEVAALTSVTNDYWLGGYKYVLQCETCGQMIGFNTKTEFVKNPRQLDRAGKIRFTHTGCGGAWKTIK